MGSIPIVNESVDSGIIQISQKFRPESTARILPRRLQVIDNFISRLGLEKELDGHKGCVNCLEWNESGEILASASDDMHLILWNPLRYEKKLIFNTGHTGNIFSVKFLPKSNSAILVTGAGDSGVRVHNVSLLDTIFICSCHTGRVKRIATVDSIPFIFWTAAEDGLILQYDMRIRHNCKSLHDRQNVLIDLVGHIGKKAEAKCVAVNSIQPELIAVGANDSYIRMYDRRMIKLSQISTGSSTQSDQRSINSNLEREDADNNIPLGCAQYFIAGSFVRLERRICGLKYEDWTEDVPHTMLYSYVRKLTIGADADGLRIGYMSSHIVRDLLALLGYAYSGFNIKILRCRRYDFLITQNPGWLLEIGSHQYDRHSMAFDTTIYRKKRHAIRLR